jgi:serine/threonine-protein kinase RsbT
MTWWDEIPIRDEKDIITARQHARVLARDLGFGITDQTRIATAVSEVARLALPGRGVLAIRTIIGGTRKGLECSCSVMGAMLEHATSVEPLQGNGVLPGLRRLVDDLRLTPAGFKTAITIQKWVR